MATYNHARFVRESIESVLKQQDVDLELLIGDDASTDGTLDVVAGVLDDRVRLFANRQHRGAAPVTNELIDSARGQYVAIINSDDYWTTEAKLATQVATLQAKPEVGACFGRARFIDSDGQRISKEQLSFGHVFDQPNRSRGEWLRYFFDTGNCLCHPTILIRRACYQELGTYRPILRQLPDFDMWIRLVKKWSILVDDSELAGFRVLPGSNASSQTPSNAVRTVNEHYLIGASFFSGVGRELMIDGFADVLVHPDIPSDEHLSIEKALQYLRWNSLGLGKMYRLIGLSRLGELLESAAHRAILAADYQIDFEWFYLEMTGLDIFHDRPLVGRVREASKGSIALLLARVRALAGNHRP